MALGVRVRLTEFDQFFLALTITYIQVAYMSYMKRVKESFWQYFR